MTIELTFKQPWGRGGDNWSQAGEIITETAALDQVRAALAEFRILAVKHWHFAGSRAPSYVIVQDIDEFLDYLQENANAGDAVDVYDITDAISEERRIASGKCPNDNGEVPHDAPY